MCVFVPNPFVFQFCQAPTVPNPLFNHSVDAPSALCIDQTLADEMITHLNQPHPDWGLDCIDNTPDDDPDNVGDDECAAGFSWDWRICRCVGQSSVCPTGVCVQTSYDPFNCDCKTPAELEEMADHSLGEDCIPGTADDPVPDDPNDCAKPCPSDEVWNYDIC